MSQSDRAEYREGVVLNKPVKEGRGSFVNVGLSKEAQIDRQLDAGLRVTVKMKQPSVTGTTVCVFVYFCITTGGGAVASQPPHTRFV